MDKKVICIVGELGSGKGTAAQYFVNQGYKFYSLSDRVKEELIKNGIEFNRENMQNTGDNLRKEFGSAVFAKMTDDLMQKDGFTNYVIESLRNPVEVQYFIDKYQANVVGVVADAKKRFEMILKRNRTGDPKNWEEFQKIDARDKGLGQVSNGQQVNACLKLADIVIENNGTVEVLYKKLNEI